MADQPSLTAEWLLSLRESKGNDVNATKHEAGN
jgi:hypothetical protein